MNETRRSADHRLAFLLLAEQLGNVSAACKTAGLSRDSYYRLKRLFEQGGEEALAKLSRRGRPLLKNRVPQEVEAAVIALAGEQPNWGQARVAKELTLKGLPISPFGVRSVWRRNGLETAEKRAKPLPETEKVKA